MVTKKYWYTLAAVWLLAALCAFGLLAYDNPMPLGSDKFWLIAQRRFDAVTAMAIVAVCQALGTVSFQTVTNNRILTPSIMGFESLYVAINTAVVFLFGVSGLVNSNGLTMFVLQMGVMIVMSLLLYSWLLTGGEKNMHAMLLVGVVIGGGLGSLSTFLKRMLTPSEFDVLTARLFGSVNNAEAEYYPIAIVLVVVASVLLFFNARRLNVVALGADVSTNLGVNHRLHAIYTLLLVSVLMATTTSLVGPMTFLGFLVATLSYQFTQTYDHRYIYAMAVGIAFFILTASYFVMQYIFRAQGVVSIIIELVGGLTFLIVIMRKGRL